jgi:hypothetical protein
MATRIEHSASLKLLDLPRADVDWPALMQINSKRRASGAECPGGPQDFSGKCGELRYARPFVVRTCIAGRTPGHVAVVSEE